MPNDPNPTTPREPYEAPAVVYEDVLEALASACADCDLGSGMKASGGTCALNGDACTSFSS